MSEKTLKTALISNAVFSTISGLVFIILGRTVADLIGIGAPIMYQIVGAGLLGFGGFTAWTGTRNPINTFIAALISVADLLWVVGTILLIALAFGLLNPAGIVALLIIAVIVLFFGLRQLHGIGKVYEVPGKTNVHKLCVAVETLEPADKMWPIVADLANIKTYSPNLAKVVLRDDAQPGVDAVRQCTDTKGKMWGEYCQRYDPQARAVDFTFLADEPGFPYPFTTMDGGWEVVPRGSGSTVNIWFEVTPKYGPAHPLILAIMAKDLAGGFGAVVARMAAAARGESVPAKPSLSQQDITSQLVSCQ